MHYSSIELKNDIEIEKLVVFHYYEFAKHFVFKGERHNFWEFLYVDEGKVEVVSENKGYILGQGDIIFHKPNEFHSVCANRKVAPNVIVVCFSCNSQSMNFFWDKVFPLGDKERELLSIIVKEGYNAFKSPLGDSRNNILERKYEAEFGAEQMIKNYLEILFVQIMRKRNYKGYDSKLSSITKERGDNEAVEHIINLFTNNYEKNYSVDDICNFSKMSKTHLTSVFKNRTGMGPIEYLRKTKLTYAKLLIREGNYNITEISYKLGYSSVHYFSRYFKKMIGVTPSEYSKSIKARIDG